MFNYLPSPSIETQIYLATPYSHPDPDVPLARFLRVTQLAGELMQQGCRVHSPISHSHPIAQLSELPRTWSFWRRQDLPMIEAAGALLVFMQEGWEDSVGVRDEIRISIARGIPIGFRQISDATVWVETDLDVEELICTMSGDAIGCPVCQRGMFESQRDCPFCMADITQCLREA